MVHNMISENKFNFDSDEEIENNNINLLVGIFLVFFAFIVVLYSIFGSDIKLKFSSDYILLYLLIIVNLLGYVLVLLPLVQTKLHHLFNNHNTLLAWAVIPLLFVVSIVLLLLMGSLKEAQNFNDPLIIGRYLLYILVPVTLVTASWVGPIKKYFENALVDVCIFLFILFWTWWGIEFTNDLTLFPHLITGFGYLLNLLAITTLTWSFFVIDEVGIKRSFSRLFTVSNFKIILINFAILMVLIVPVGLLISFLQFTPGNLINKGILGAIIYLFLAVLGVFLVQGIGEELLFRGLFYFVLLTKIKELSDQYRGYILLALFFFVAVLIALTPYVGLANNINTGIVNSHTIPLKIIYPIIAIIYFVIGIVFMMKTKNVMYTMVLWSSMLFGWAHFEDWRYLIFATIAGLGYCETYRRTDNLFAASMIHMLVDVTWGAILTG